MTGSGTPARGERRAVITGVGMVVPGGVGREAAWTRLCSGVSAVRGITAFDPTGFRSRIAAEIDFDARACGLSAQAARRMDRAAQFAVVCAREAAADAGLEVTDPAVVDPATLGVVIGSAVGCTTRLEEEYEVLSDGGRRWVVDHEYAVPHLYDYMVPSSLAAEVATEVGAEGPVALVSTGCTSGLDAIGHAAALIEDGELDVVVAGATDAPLAPITSACFDAIAATSPNNDHPEIASRPFDGERDGFVLGEGSAVMIIEEEAAARRRGARIYGRVAGFASRSNAFHMTGLRPDGREMAEAITVALDLARLDREAVDYINAHGSSTRQNDRHETAAFKVSLGPRAYQVPVSSLKSVVGHSLGAIGAIEVAACALVLDRQVVPPTANLCTPDPECDLDYVPREAREHRTDAVLSVGSGFGGFQSAMVLQRV